MRVSSSQEGDAGATTKVVELVVVRGWGRAPPRATGEVGRPSIDEAAAGPQGRESPNPELGSPSSEPGRANDGGFGETASYRGSLPLDWAAPEPDWVAPEPGGAAPEPSPGGDFAKKNDWWLCAGWVPSE